MILEPRGAAGNPGKPMGHRRFTGTVTLVRPGIVGPARQTHFISF
jgi:hypothetical protein